MTPTNNVYSHVHSNGSIIPNPVGFNAIIRNYMAQVAHRKKCAYVHIFGAREFKPWLVVFPLVSLVISRIGLVFFAGKVLNSLVGNLGPTQLCSLSHLFR